MPANTYTLIEKIVVGAAGASSVTFTSIPQTYTDLKIVASTRATNNDNEGDVVMTFNGTSSSSDYSLIMLRGSGAGTASFTYSTFNANRISYTSSASNTASTFGSFEVYIPNYSVTTTAKSSSIDGVQENNITSNVWATLVADLWNPTTKAAITSINFQAGGGGLFAQYSTFYLYGIAKEGVSPSPSSAPYATGGDSIVFDGTYWIHTFTSSGTFTPKKGLTCDYLVVAGGGGNPGAAAGGGGAGGMRCTVTATGGGGSLESALSLTANTGYTVTIGGGGSSGAGSNSVFGSITATGGGAPGLNAGNGSTGGSGGGGGYGASTTGGAGTANQGYAGGTGVGTSTDRGGGGGGGAGAVGGNGNATGGIPGNGGNGVATSISGSSVTYAGGGGGGGYGTSGGTGGTGGGGNGSRQSQSATAGTANTGGGGGGSYYTGGGAGGSGIVIVRYAA